MADTVYTTCKGCRRCIEARHLDRDGFCCFCTKKPETIPSNEATQGDPNPAARREDVLR